MNDLEFTQQLDAISSRVLSKAIDSDGEANYTEALFESIRHINEHGQKFWYARKLQKALGYTEFNKFLPAINRAMNACDQSGNSISDHFAQVSEMIRIGSGAEREFSGYHLSRYACYFIVQNGDPRKKVIALGQSYFAIKTRQQELIENYEELTEDQKSR